MLLARFYRSRLHRLTRLHAAPILIRLAIRIVNLAQVPAAGRWRAEAQALRDHRPRFNALLPQTAEQKRLKWNAYCRSNSKRYYAAHPEKLEAKRAKDRERIAAKRAAVKQANEPANVA